MIRNVHIRQTQARPLLTHCAKQLFCSANITRRKDPR